MKKLYSFVIISVLIISGLGAVSSTPTDVNSTSFEEQQSIHLTKPCITETIDYTSITLAEATSYSRIVGEPILPRITKQFILPFGCSDVTVQTIFSVEQEIHLTKPIRPASEPRIDGSESVVSQQSLGEIYSSTIRYPETRYTYQTSTGLVDGMHVVFLTVSWSPIQYQPKTNTIFYSDAVDISVHYTAPASPIIFDNVYDLIVIAPQNYEAALQPLVDHKNSYGMKTILVPLEDIYTDYTSGRDAAENVKLFIYDAVNPSGLNWGPQYVLFVGGMSYKLEDWIVPVRYTNNHVGGTFEHGVLSDLYYADIFKNNGTEFEDWDSNGNGIFAEYTLPSKDVLDGAPDIYVGRLACSSTKEVTTMVNKIITYESTKADDAWFKRMLLIGGDTYPDTGPSYEAEIDTNVSASFMTGFTFERLWASQGTLTGQKVVEQAFSQGAGFVHCAGHANPSILVTHPPEDEGKITIMHMYNLPPVNAIYALFYQGLGIKGFFTKLFERWMPRLTNNDKLPVVVVGGCHNSQFNTSLANIVEDGFTHAYGYGDFVPKCWSWWLTSKKTGGAIATMGNSGLGMGLQGFDYPNGLDGWLLPRFFYNYGQLGKNHVGEAHSAAITDYVNEFDINSDDADRQMVEQWVLLGDPSLRIGGYD